MTDTDRLIAIASQLLDHGLHRSACTVLNQPDLYGRRINTARRLAKQRSQYAGISNGVFAVGTDGDVGCVIPLFALPGIISPPGMDSTARVGHDVAFDTAVSLMGIATFPKLYIQLPDMLELQGGSAALPMALAFLARLTGRHFPCPVIATGRLAAYGSVLPVDQFDTKISAAVAELSGTNGIILAPPAEIIITPGMPNVHHVSSLSEAAKAIWGDTSFELDRNLLELDTLISKSKAERDHRKAAQLLLSRPLEGLPDADRALLLLETGIRLRHTGESQRALELHEEACSIATFSHEALLPSEIEAIEVETLATRMGLHDFEILEPRLLSRLSVQSGEIHNEIKCRGMLAQLFSATGRHNEVIALRELNLERQAFRTKTIREIPRTLSSLVWETARLGDRELFFENVERLLESTSDGDSEQTRYNDSAIVRGMVLLKHYDELSRWLTGDGSLLQSPPSAGLKKLLQDTSSITNYPEVSTARALARYLRRSQNQLAAVSLCQRIPSEQTEPLLRWLSLLSNIEHALAHGDLGKHKKARELLQDANTALSEIPHPVNEFYKDLLRSIDSNSTTNIEAQLDLIYY